MQSKNSKNKSTYNNKSRYPTATKNPCNQFLVQFLIKLRQKQCNMKLLKGKPRQDHQFHVYTKAIDSIRKYPLPIICGEQLGLLAGVGDCLNGKLILAIKEYYKKYLKVQNGELKPREKEQMIATKSLQDQREQHVKVLNWTPSSEGSNIGSSRLRSINSEISQQSQNSSQNRDKMQYHHIHSANSFEYDKQSSKSENLSQKKSVFVRYKPRNGSQASNVLKVLKILGAATTSFTKRDIDKALLQHNYEKIKQWKKCKETLIKNGYIEPDPSVQFEAFFMTNKAQEYLNQYQTLQFQNVTKKKIEQQIVQFKQKQAQRQKQQASQSMSFALSQQLSQGNSRSNYSNTNTRPFSNLNEGFVSRKILEKKENQRLIIVIDTRQMKDQSQKSYFQQTLAEKYKIDVITHVLSIGDFAFSYNGQVLDYIIERKKADDLSASITDGRYKQQKFRLKNCGASNIIYLYEGHPSESSVLKEKQLMNALLKTRVVDGFKVLKTTKISETAKYLYHLYSELELRISIQSGKGSQSQLTTIGTLQQFNRRNTKNRYLTVENIFGFGLKSFPNVGKQTVTNILRYFKSYYLLYKQLQKYRDNNERVQFLNGLLKGGRTQGGVTNLIVQFLFNGDEKQKIMESVEGRNDLLQN